ncbi:MAG: phenylalanine--tRNA ligase subunit beta [Candidatus Eremiobacteraeota bacterium]|nr:phenylalanine--tRNA ligase subunit beta [Candidatus Eremiobacteraeota bacterium]
MKLPLSWLKDYVDVDIAAEDLAEKLTSVGIPVESITYLSPDVKGVIAAKIMLIKSHPNADKLVVTDMKIGEDLIQVVTGAQNVKEGDIVPLAINGARLFGGLKIKRSKIRGQESNGMMCSAKELGIDLKDLPIEQREGVLILPPDTPPGADVTQLYCLNDPVLEFEIFANRPDQLSILGIARETAGVLGKKMRIPEIKYPEIPDKASDFIKIEIEDMKLCPKYSARIIRNVPIKKSPLWMQGRLYAAGMRPINNIVDITNYVMLETGQPLHAFDLDKIKGGLILVRPARDGETIISLDGEERKLDPDMLMITDVSETIAIAGVMGGLNSEVGEDTKNVLLEAASFSAPSVRRTSIRQKLKSESSRRFEKGIDYHCVELASRRACHLMEKEGGKVLAGESVCSVTPPGLTEIFLRPRRVNHILGTDIDRGTIKELLEGLDFKVEDRGEAFLVTAPTVRRDINEEIDLVEEVARLWGYDNIPTTTPIGVSLGSIEPETEFDERLRNILARCGMYEIITLSLHGEEKIGEYRIDDRDLLRVKNPVTTDQQLLRADAVPHIMDVLKRNMANRRFDFKLFEISKLYRDIGKNEPEERRELTLVMSAPDGDKKEYDFFAMKGIIELIASRTGQKLSYKKDEFPYLHPGKTAKISSNGEKIGIMGYLHPEIAKEQGIEQDVVIGRIFIDKIRELEKSLKFREIPRFPPVERDLSVLLDDSIPAIEVEEVIQKKGKPIITDVYCYDVYKGKQIPEHKKSMTFKLTFSSPERTLTDEEVQKKIDKILKLLEEKVEASLRG